MLKQAEMQFNVSSRADARYLLGHSNGGDMALLLLFNRPNEFGGVVAVSPACASMIVGMADLPAERKQRIGIALSYTQHDLTPGFLSNTAECRGLLQERGIRHLVQYCPGASHDPASMAPFMPAALGFVVA
jgi:enterochelin esterase-like enzyme